jgi:hypothetical protein
LSAGVVAEESGDMLITRLSEDELIELNQAFKTSMLPSIEARSGKKLAGNRRLSRAESGERRWRRQR